MTVVISTFGFWNVRFVRVSEVRLIVDSRFVLTGDIIENQPCSCLFSSSDTLVILFKDSMKNEIKLIELGELN